MTGPTARRWLIYAARLAAILVVATLTTAGIAQLVPDLSVLWRGVANGAVLVVADFGFGGRAR